MDFLWAIDPNFLVRYLPPFMLSDFMRTAFLFTLAAWVHSGRVKKEIKIQFQYLTDAIHGVESKLGPAIDSLDNRVKVLETTFTKGNK